jgi:hypothetical protein
MAIPVTVAIAVNTVFVAFLGMITVTIVAIAWVLAGVARLLVWASGERS